MLLLSDDTSDVDVDELKAVPGVFVYVFVVGGDAPVNVCMGACCVGEKCQHESREARKSVGIGAKDSPEDEEAEEAGARSFLDMAAGPPTIPHTKAEPPTTPVINCTDARGNPSDAGAAAAAE